MEIVQSSHRAELVVSGLYGVVESLHLLQNLAVRKLFRVLRNLTRILLGESVRLGVNRDVQTQILRLVVVLINDGRSRINQASHGAHIAVKHECGEALVLLVVYHGEREFAADDVVATRRCNAQTSRYADDALLSDGLRCVLRVLSAVEVEAAVDVVNLDWRNLQTHSRADSDVEVAPSEVVAFLLVLEVAAV